jgi:hypothetical protein
MNALECAVQEALVLGGQRDKANKAYLEFIKANFIIPIEKTQDDSPKVLFLEEAGEIFLPVFSSEDYLNAWVSSIKEDIHLLRLTGVDLLKGIGQGVTVLLNIDSPVYKAFNPAEIERMRGMVLKIFLK